MPKSTVSESEAFFSSPFSFLCDLFFCAQRVEREHRECFPLRLWRGEGERECKECKRQRVEKRDMLFFSSKRSRLSFFPSFFASFFPSRLPRPGSVPPQFILARAVAARGHWAEATLSLGWFSREEGGGKQQKEGERGSRLSHSLPLSSSSPTPFFPPSLLPSFPCKGAKKI